MSKTTNVLLTHGAWADGSCWTKVIPILQAQGLKVVAAQIPLTSLEDDIAVTRHLPGPHGRADGRKDPHCRVEPRAVHRPPAEVAEIIALAC